MAKFMKGLAVFFLIAGFIGGIILGNVYPSAVANHSWSEPTSTFNLILFISSVLASVLLFGIVFSIGYALELLERIAAPERIQPMKKEYTMQPSRSDGSLKAGEGHVNCKRCGEENRKSEIYCSKCGNKL